MGQDIKRDGIQLVTSIYRANIEKDKRKYLESFLDDFEILKLEKRICTDMKILSLKKQAELSLLMDSIGRQITGWVYLSGGDAKFVRKVRRRTASNTV